MKKKMGFTLLLCLTLMLAFASAAFAHVGVSPQQTTQGAYEKFTFRVPTEKDIPTVKIEIKFPADVTVSRFEPKPDWKYEATTDASGKITGVVWTSLKDGLSKTEFGEFSLQGKVGDQATSLVWKAYQTYKDGSVVEWTGAAGSDKPAPVTTVAPKPAGAATDSHGAAPAAGTASNGTASTASNTSLYLSIAALVVALIAAAAAFTKRAKK